MMFSERYVNVQTLHKIPCVHILMLCTCMYSSGLVSNKYTYSNLHLFFAQQGNNNNHNNNAMIGDNDNKQTLLTNYLLNYMSTVVVEQKEQQLIAGQTRSNVM